MEVVRGLPRAIFLFLQCKAIDRVGHTRRFNAARAGRAMRRSRKRFKMALQGVDGAL
jgi:hypothetical protein